MVLNEEQEDLQYQNLTWDDAVQRVLKDSSEPMHYGKIASEIVERRLRRPCANPAISVNTAIQNSIREYGADSPYIKISRAIYWLRDKVNESAPFPVSEEEEEEMEAEETGLIKALGMYWSRESVLWKKEPRILGQQQTGGESVDFCRQRGVYLLHDGRSVVYVGRTTGQDLGVRLRQHTTDRLNGRWDRFSWFGVRTVTEDGSLKDEIVNASYNSDMLIATMEALLIEGLEPPQNRKRGDDFSAIEYLQVKDPELQKDAIIKLIDELKQKLYRDEAK